MFNDFENTVGYKNPPKASQFQKGKSGNPGGRPKHEPDIAGVLRKISRQKVRTNGPNGVLCMTKLEAGLTQLLNKAASGDLRALKILAQLVYRFQQDDGDSNENIVVHFREV